MSDAAPTIDHASDAYVAGMTDLARAVWKPRPDLRTAVEAWFIAGGAHHTVLTTAIDPEPLADLAEMAGIEFLLIDADTTVSAFRKEVRWNSAYHYLARGL